MHTLMTIWLIIRAAWIATVANIDWPSTVIPFDSTATAVQVDSVEQAQRAEMVSILDSLQALHFNAVIFQIRPTADALYMSELEPRSRWVGQGEYDPLDFVIAEAHARGMEVHAWVNPYRISLKGYPMQQAPAAELRFRYGDQWFYNPGLAPVRDWICDVVEDIVCRYAVDAIHMDDYFYPYAVAGQRLPDVSTFRADPRGFESIEDWRRDNVNLVVAELSRRIHATRPGCRFGISPFGINDKNYNELYADVLLWLREGWIDYVAPQLYWPIGHKTADYRRLAAWWAEHCYGRDLYIGLADYRFDGPELMRQIRLDRTMPQITGECFYSTRPLLRNNGGICDSLRSLPPDSL